MNQYRPNHSISSQHEWRTWARIGGVLIQDCACGRTRQLALWPDRRR